MPHVMSRIRTRLAALRPDRRAAVGLMVGVMAPGFFGMAAMVVDAGFWVIGQTRLQVAADAGAMAASYLLTNSTFQGYNAATQASTAQAVALAEAQSAATKLVGTINTPAVTIGSGYQSVTVKLTSQMPSYFFGVFGITAPLVSATAVATLKANGPCILMLAPSGTDIKVDNQGTVAAAGCPIGSNSTSAASVYVNSGTVSGTAIDIPAPGTLSTSNSGSNSVSPSTATNLTGSDPDAKLGRPAYPSNCNTTGGNFNSSDSSTKVFTPAAQGGFSNPVYTFCGNTSFTGNGTTATFNAGTYYVVDGSLTFSNQNISTSGGTSFILTGSGPATTGNFSWQNYSNTFAINPATSGVAATPKIALWLACNTGGNQTATFNGGSTLSITGTVYMPCAAVNLSNNAVVSNPLNSSLSFIAYSLYATGSAALRTATSGSGGGSGAAVLTQ